MIVTNILIEGLIYSVVLGVIITTSQLFNARLWLNDYPEAIQNTVAKRTNKEKIMKIVIGIPFILIMFGYPVYSTYVLKKTLGLEYNFWYGFINTLAIGSAFNLFDLLILDWLIFCYVNPKFLILEGTKDMKEYKDYNFHFKAAIKGFIISLVFSGVVALITLI